MATPPGISERDFARALSELRNAVGAELVFTSDEDLNLYRDAYSPFKGEAEDRVPSAAVAPTTVEQVQAIVRIANAHPAFGVGVFGIYPIPTTGVTLGTSDPHPLVPPSLTTR